MTDLQRSGVDHPQVEPGHARDIGPLESDERREGRVHKHVIESPRLRKGLRARLVTIPWSKEVQPRRFKKRCVWGKIRWESKQDAEIALSRLPNIGGYVYQCPACGRWHLSSGSAA